MRPILLNMRPWPVILALAIVTACEPQNAQTTRAPTPGSPTPAATTAAGGAASAEPSPAGASATPGGASIAPGTAVVSSAGPVVQVNGNASVLNSPSFALSGNVVMKLSAVCSSPNSIFPFVWVYSASGPLVGQYVDEVNHLKKLSGKYYVTTSADPGCNWTITFTPE